MLLFSIISACLLATVIAIVTAYSLNGRILDRWGAGLSCVSTGLLLTLAFTHLLPEAFEHAADPRHIGIALWAACVLLFTLEQLFDLHHHSHGCEKPIDGSLRIRGVWPIVIGDSLHTFTDGIVIASSFLVSPHLGWAITAGILLHELPQEVGDFVLLTRSGLSREKAFRLLLLAGASAATGGLLGYLVLDWIRGMLPYALALSAASFLYISMCELIPRLVVEGGGHKAFRNRILLFGLGSVIAFLIGLEH